MITPLVTLLAALVSEAVAQTPRGELRVRLRPAGPGIKGTLRPDEMVVYRTSRTRAETDKVLAALASGRPQDAFRASTHVNPELTGHSGLQGRVDAALRRGQKPLFVSPYPTVTWLYHSFVGSPLNAGGPPSVSITLRAGDRIFVVERSAKTSHPETWASPGGAIDPGEDPWQAAVREFTEEVGGLPPGAKVTSTFFDGRHTGFLVDVPVATVRSWRPELNWECTASAWMSSREILSADLLGPFADLLVEHWGTIFEGAPPDSLRYQQTASRRHEPVTWAIIVPLDALIWENTRARQTQGIFHSLMYADAEFIIDANQIREIRWVPDEILVPIGEATKALKATQSVRGMHRNTFKDRDPALAEAARDAVTDLRMPPVQLGRPFIEVPMELPGVGGVLKNQRVLLKDGQITKLQNARAWRPGGSWNQTVELDAWQEDPAVSVRLTGRGHKNWTPQYGPLNNDNLSWEMVERPLLKGERVSIKARRELWRKNRDEILNLIAQQSGGYKALLTDRGGSDEGLEAAITELDDLVRLAAVDTPPWEVPPIPSYTVYQGRSTRSLDFSDAHIDPDGHMQDGPGFYFTSSPADARTYARGPQGTLLQATLRPRKWVKHEGHVDEREVMALLRAAPNIGQTVLDWDMGDGYLPIHSMMKGMVVAGAPWMTFQQVWGDAYHRQPGGDVAFVQQMRKLGYDAAISPGQWGEGVTHYIVYNPAIISNVQAVS